ncbi:T9SS type B sorting domain-containing protein [Polaribacter aestuariivivens]|uniref:T9SS type B sorting domain-containing protein n=1 Tax=Polaribacter aestuariivivens TaxID=2304626 RepID=A0A5S3N360_9FLAO|nr:T9SS type B sorting domain-containing protein [Polaribacter aestuariivivens]TMM29673.1 T9SS type B sorting domain-containing protein [Polaribacter aestuariivivens]
MNKSTLLKNNIFSILFLLITVHLYAQVDSAPELFAEGNQVFCPGNAINIVTNFSITDSDDTTLPSFFVQISSGYQLNFDVLELTGNHPNIRSNWNDLEGKLTLTSSNTGSEMLLTDLENAVKNIQFKTSAINIEIKKSFSLAIDNANYLPSTDHFYEFVSAPRITWKSAKIAAENRTFYGRKGYLATLISQEEADFAGKQASGAGWIGGSDEETEGVWKWVTGPETGTIFWRGQISGTTPNFAFWNNGEPNDFRGNDAAGEDYAHITDPNVNNVIIGSWNDLPNAGGTNLYVPKGYIVEYGVPSDPPLSIVASTHIYIPQINTITEATVCESGIATISALSNEGQILWYESQTNGTPIFTGNDFTITVTDTTTFYATVSVNGCTSLERIPVKIIVNQRPNIISVENDLICSGTALLTAIASDGEINWYNSATSTTPIFTGENFRTPPLTTTTSYYVEANNFNCISSTRTEVVAEVDTTIPNFDIENENVALCKDIGSVTLKVINAQGTYTYIWKKDGAVFPENNSEISVTEAGDYTVKAFSEAGCESLEKSISVTNSEIATITKDDILIVDDSDNNSITIQIANLGTGNYEFTLDNEFGTYKDIGFFEGITVGIHTLFVKDKGGCGTQKYEFSILEYPKFFTPNNDGNNDFWHLKGYNKDFYTISDIYIYNRFGALLHKITKESKGWNGTFKGKLLPSNSYWFQTILTDKNGLAIKKTGSFSLIRK